MSGGTGRRASAIRLPRVRRPPRASAAGTGGPGAEGGRRPGRSPAGRPAPGGGPEAAGPARRERAPQARGSRRGVEPRAVRRRRRKGPGISLCHCQSFAQMVLFLLWGGRLFLRRARPIRSPSGRHLHPPRAARRMPCLGRRRPAAESLHAPHSATSRGPAPSLRWPRGKCRSSGVGKLRAREDTPRGRGAGAGRPSCPTDEGRGAHGRATSAPRVAAVGRSTCRTRPAARRTGSRSAGSNSARFPATASKGPRTRWRR